MSSKAEAEAQAADWCCSRCGGPVAAQNCGRTNFPEAGILWQLRCEDETCDGYKHTMIRRRNP